MRCATKHLWRRNSLLRERRWTEKLRARLKAYCTREVGTFCDVQQNFVSSTFRKRRGRARLGTGVQCTRRGGTFCDVQQTFRNLDIHPYVSKRRLGGRHFRMLIVPDDLVHFAMCNKLSAISIFTLLKCEREGDGERGREEGQLIVPEKLVLWGV